MQNHELVAFAVVEHEELSGQMLLTDNTVEVGDQLVADLVQSTANP